MALEPALLELSGITKHFGEIVANSEVDFRLGHGEIVGLLGENGAGKTTLMNIAFGLYRPDAGTIAVNGRKVQIHSTADAMSHGIGMVHQHTHVVNRHTVIENLIVGLPGRGGFLDKSPALARLAEIRKSYGLYLEPDRQVSDLAVGEKQRLDIIKALFRKARILILDEPTSVLTPQEGEGLFSAVRALAEDGVGVVLISHKLNDVRANTNRVVVMRRGALVAELNNDGKISNSQLATLMCGSEPERTTRSPSRPGTVRLELKEIVLSNDRKQDHRSKPSNLRVSSGEIVGIAGVSGNGQVALAETIAGLRRAAAGTMRIDGRDFSPSGIKAAQDVRLTYVPEDRIGSGFAGSLTAAENMVLSRFRAAPFSRYGWLDRRAIVDFAADLMERYDVRPPSPMLRMTQFSGGNQQKAIVAREVAFSPSILVIAQPTRGLDVSAANFVQRKLIEMSEQGCAIVMISDDLDEIFQLSDRICVMYDGSIVFDRPNDSTTIEEVGLAMSGEKS